MMKLLYVIKVPLLLLTMLVSLLLLLSAYAGYLNPAICGKYLLSIILLFPVLIVSAVVLLIVWWILSKRVFFALLLVILAISPVLWTYSPLNLFSSESKEKGQLRVVSYNVHGGKGEKGKQIGKYLLQLNPDIIALQEYAVPKNGVSPIYTQLKSEYPHYHFYPKSWTMGQRQGIALFSKYPIKKKTPIKYESQRNSSVLYELDIYRSPLKLINNHFESMGLTGADRNYLKEVVEGDKTLEEDVPYRVLNTIGTASIRRAGQVDLVRSVVDTINTPLIVCGDFNDTPLSYSYRTLKKGLTDSYVEKGIGPGFTFFVNPIMVRIDHMFNSNDLTVVNCEINHIPYSDHYPLIVDYRWSEKQ